MKLDELIKTKWEEYYGEPIDDGLEPPWYPAVPVTYEAGFKHGMEHFAQLTHEEAIIENGRE